MSVQTFKVPAVGVPTAGTARRMCLRAANRTPVVRHRVGSTPQLKKAVTAARPARPLSLSKATASSSSGSTAGMKDAEESNGSRPALKSGFHVHFGAGKLGMGLVFQAMAASNVPFAVMQPPFPGECDEIMDDEYVHVIVNDEDALPEGLRVIKSENYQDLKEQMLKERCLVLMHEGPEWDEIISNATSFSCSIGPKVNDIIGPVLERNKDKVPFEMRPQLFACENDHNAVEQLDARLKGRVEVVPCMVDRICSGREIVKGAIKVTTEPWKGTLVPLTPQPEEEDAVFPMPFGGRTVFVPNTERESDYMYERKIMTVNHMHTTLAFMSLVKYMEDNNLDPEDLVEGESACISAPLVKWDSSLANPRTNTIWCWAVAQCLLLMSEHDRKTMMKSHKCTTDDEFVEDLLSRAKDKLNRFAAVDDSTARVLNAGVDLRYHGRLLPAYEAVKNLAGLLDEWPDNNRYTKLMEAAGVGIQDILNACEYLVRAAEPIAKADAAKYNLATPEPEQMYAKLLSQFQKAANAVIDWEQSTENWVEGTAKEARDAISTELEHFAEAGVRDLSLDWVVCKLEALGFRNVAQWEDSVKPTYGAKPKKSSSEDEEEQEEAVEMESTEQGVLIPGWMVSWEESKRKEKAPPTNK
mmetsp:Transcript_26408/g.46989  ORF Transcript_26408/g.46989 Transcript_26408/m.46989 type:complete len:640 (-) Transcript_26408:299-2218(-)